MITLLREYLPRLWCLMAHRRFWRYDATPMGLRGLAHYECARCGKRYFEFREGR